MYSYRSGLQEGRVYMGYFGIGPILRPVYSRLWQLGLLPAGIEIAPRRHQLHRDLSTQPIADAALDVQNAHTSASRLSCYLTAASHAHQLADPIVHRFRLYILSYYHFPTATYIQVGASYHLYWQTDGLDQGEALASHAFGLCLGTAIATSLAPSVPSLISTLVHDDTTMAALILACADDPIPPTPTAATPLPHAIALYSHLLLSILRCVLAGHKTHILLPPGFDSAPIAHLFPAGTTFSHTFYILAGSAVVASPTALPSVLLADLRRYASLLQRLRNIPSITPHLRTLILTLSCRPSSTFALPLRYHPPSTTTALPLPLGEDAAPTPSSFASSLRHHCYAALAHSLQLPARRLHDPPPPSATDVQLGCPPPPAAA